MELIFCISSHRIIQIGHHQIQVWCNINNNNQSHITINIKTTTHTRKTLLTTCKIVQYQHNCMNRDNKWTPIIHICQIMECISRIRHHIFHKCLLQSVTWITLDSQTLRSTVKLTMTIPQCYAPYWITKVEKDQVQTTANHHQPNGERMKTVTRKMESFHQFALRIVWTILIRSPCLWEWLAKI